MDKIKALFDDLDHRLRSPFILSFIIAWLIWNWELVYSVFSFGSEYSYFFKIDFIKCYIGEHPYKLSLIPLGLCVTATIFFYLMSLLFLSLDTLYQEKLRPGVINFWAPSRVIERTVFESTLQKVEDLNKKITKQQQDFADSTSEIQNLQVNNQKLTEANAGLNERMKNHDLFESKAKRWDESIIEIPSLSTIFYGEWICEFQFTNKNKVIRGAESFNIEDQSYFIKGQRSFTISGAKMFNDVLEFDKAEFKNPQTIRHTKLQKVSNTLWMGTENMNDGNYSIVRFYPKNVIPRDLLFRFLDPLDDEIPDQIKSFWESVNGRDLLATKERLKVIKASYGTDKNTFDATQAIRQLIKNNRIDFVINNELVGDPDPAVIKKLVIEYELDGKKDSRTYNEGARVII